MQSHHLRSRYDVVVAGARAAGASTAMLLARQGLSVLVVDPMRPGADTLSTHALMRGAVMQLGRWGLLDTIRGAGTPIVRSASFHYAEQVVDVDIKPGSGIDGLYAPRRTLLDKTLLDAAAAAGAQVALGLSVDGLLWSGSGRVKGVRLSGPGRDPTRVAAELVIGADGRRSRVARHVAADIEHFTPHATATIYGYWPGLTVEGYHFHYRPGIGAGSIPTNDGETNVFVGMSPLRFHAERRNGLDVVFWRALEEAAPDLYEMMRASSASVKLRGFAGAPGYLRRAVGPGWALVGDAGYFRDPFTAHGITDALRDAELLARAVAAGTEDAFSSYHAIRNQVSLPLLETTDRLASFEWSLPEAQQLHRELSHQMKEEVALIETFDRDDETAASPFLRKTA